MTCIRLAFGLYISSVVEVISEQDLPRSASDHDQIVYSAITVDQKQD